MTVKILTQLNIPAVLSLAGFGVTSALNRRHEIEAEAEQDLYDYARVLEDALPPLATRLDDTALIAALERMANRQRVHGIVMYDRNCHALARSERFAANPGPVDELVCRAPPKHTERRGIVRLGDHDVLIHAEVVEGAEDVAIIAVGYDLSEVREAVRDNAVRIATVGSLVLAGMALLAFAIARRLGASLSTLLTGVERVASGELAVRVIERGMLGTERVARGFNQMTVALADARDRLESAEQHRRDLERRILHAQTLSAVGQFAASLAHDIGSPLSTILMASRLSAADEELPEAARKQFDLVATQCARVTRIVQQLLSVARPSRAQRSRVELASVVSEVIAFIEREGRRRRVKVRAEIPSEPVTIEADRDALLQMLVNVAMNGLQAQPDGGDLVIAVTTDGKSAFVDVRDAGPGIPDDAKTTVFEPFFSTKAPGEGTGLGLSIAATVVRDMDGTIEVTTAPEGGACIRIAVPIPPPVDHR